MSDDPFRPIGGKATKLRVVASDDNAWTPVAPVPADAPPAPSEHPTLGAPSVRWPYPNVASAPLGYVLRFDRPGGKEFRPLTPWRSKSGALVWRWVSWPEPRPLYGLDRLAARPVAPVIVCEGEKAADAAGRLAPEAVAITSPGGARAAGKSDWSPMKGRRVVIWPDSDEPGGKYAQEAAEACLEAGAASVAIVEPPAGVAEGWDAADAEAEAWTPERVRAHLAAAAPISGARAPKRRAAAAKPPKRERGAAPILSLFDEDGVEFWHDAAKNAYATVLIDGHRESFPIESRDFQHYVAGRADDLGLTPPNGTTLADAQRVFSARAINRGPEKEPFQRVGMWGGRWYVALGDKRWRVVEIDGNGWRVLETHNLPVIRSQALRPLPDPEPTDEGLGLLRGFVNASDDGFKLAVAWLLASLSPCGPYPLLCVGGEQGSAKSTLCRLLRSLVDPNIAPLRALPRDETDLLVAALHAHVLAFDNVSKISAELSDALCRVATGAGLSARKKFTDGEEFVIFTKSPCVLNGIPSLTSRPDLASRSLVVTLDPIPEEARRTEAELDAEWNAVAPKILAILFDVLSSALRKLPDVRLARASRMADFERLIVAAEGALDWEPGEFSRIYRANQSEQDAEAIEGSAVAEAIVALIESDHPEGWEGTAARLLELLRGKVSDAVARSRMWPDNNVALGIQLSRLAPVLRRAGLTVEKHHSGKRWLTIRPTSKPEGN